MAHRLKALFLDLFRRSQVDRELDAELSFHLASQVEANLSRGMTPEEARRRANLDLGGLEQVKEAVRSIRPGYVLDTAWQDLRFGWRMLRKSPGFTMVAVLTLALGIGASTAIFSVVKAVLLNELPYHQPERLVTIAATDSVTLNPVNVSYLLAQDYKERSHSFRSISLYRDWGPALSARGRSSMLRGLRVSADLFDTLGVAPVLGRGFTAEEDRPEHGNVVVLSHGFWKEQFAGRMEVIGQTILLNERPFEVVGVLPESFRPLIFSYAPRPPQVWAPLAYDASLPYACRSCQHLRAVARLGECVGLESARAELRAISSSLAREFPQDYPPDASAVVTLLHERVVGPVTSALWLIFCATGLVLLIACTNVANLQLSRVAARTREISLRSALGAGRLRLARQGLTEATLLTLLGGATGMLVANWGVSALASWAPVAIPRLEDVVVDRAAFGFALALSLATAFVVGLAPALRLARADHRDALGQGARGTAGPGDRRFRSALIVAQVSLAFVLTAGTGLLVKSLDRLLAVDPGFDAENLLTANLALLGSRYGEDDPSLQFLRQALEGVRAIPGVDAAALVTTLPLGGSFDRRGFHIQDRRLPSDAEAPSVDGYYVSDGYFRSMGIPVLRGRDFTAADLQSASAPVAVISESAARKMWPGQEALGQRIQLGGREENGAWAPIVGIVGEVHQVGLDVAPAAGAYLPLTQAVPSYPVLVVRSRLPQASLLSSIEQRIATIDPEVPLYGAATMGELIADSVAQRRFVAMLVGGFGVLALLLAAMGLYGTLGYQVTQRTVETGIRMALGAPRRTILRLFVAEGLRVTTLGLALGVLAALGLTRLMAAHLFQVRAEDPAVLSAAAAVLVLCALLACWIPARRATRIDPMVALRCEWRPGACRALRPSRRPPPAPAHQI